MELSTLVALMVCLLSTATSSRAERDWTQGMFTFQFSLDDIFRLPAPGHCKFIQCPVNGFVAYSGGCTQVPPYPDGYRDSRLSLLGTGLRVLSSGAFATWGQLVSLRIDMNSELIEIEPRVFFHLTSLTNLSISNNYNLGHLDSEVFDGLVNLRELRFVKNNLKTLFHFTFAARPYLLPSLVFLDLSSNPLQSISRADFIEMEDSPLENLHLRFCSLDSIEEDSFSGFKRLKSLDLGHNNLTPDVLIKVISSVNETSLEIKHLGISANLLNKHFYKLLRVISYTNISSLDMSFNHFDLLSSYFFPKMPNLETLDLSGVSAFDVQIGTFGTSLLPKLKHLHFSANKLLGFASGLRLPGLVELDISQNSCNDCDVTSLFKIEDNDMENMISLEVLNLSRNNIFHISKFMFFGLESLRALYLSNCTIYSIHDYAFSDLAQLEHLDLSHNVFTGDRLSSTTFDGLNNLSSLRLDMCAITILNNDVFLYLSSLKYLTLRDNSLIDIDPLLFFPLTLIVRIDLSNNDIMPWKGRIFENNNELETLSVAANHLYRYTPEMILDFANINTINMRENPIQCNCDLVRTILDSGECPENMYGLNDSSVKCVSPRLWSDERVMEFIELNSTQYDCMHWSLLAAIIAVCALFILLTCSVTIYYLRWYLRYWLFLFKQTWRATFPGKKPEKRNSKYKYDAFVSYSNEDRHFVVRLVAMMENYEPYFRLCVFERDFNAGEVICESVVDCLTVSKKTILILTDAFARSQWCQWELQMAHHKRFFFKSESQDSLILIKLGDIMEANMTPTLKYLMKTRIYLQWYPDPKRQRIFWQKLREALRSPIRNDMITSSVIEV